MAGNPHFEIVVGGTGDYPAFDRQSIKDNAHSFLCREVLGGTL